MFKRLLVILISGLFCCAPVHSQKVAVILSGGASKGGAHIGVLRALEEQHIPISFIAGTSVGAIIGGLYASGYTPDEIEKLISSEEFQRNASGLMYDQYVYYYRREEPNASWISLDLNPKKKLTSSLPVSLKSPFMVDFRFMEIFAPPNAAAEGDFNKLFIPFRCVVADIDSSSAVIIKKGDLPSAIRASMSIPFVYNPVVLNNKLMYDGGMYNNFPTNVAADDFKADVIIGSRVAERYDKPDPEDPVSQLLVMLMGKQSSNIPYPNSVLILPNVPKVDLLDFSHTAVLADSGYAAAMRSIASIRKLVHDTVNSEDLLRRRKEFRSRQPALIFDSIITKGLNRAQSTYVKQVLKHGKELISLDELRPGYYRFIDEGFVKTIYPVARYNPQTAHYDLILDIHKSDKFSADFGGNLSLGTVNEAFLEIRYKYLWSKALHFLANGYFGKSCAKNPRSDNLMVRRVHFNHSIIEENGFMPLSNLPSIQPGSCGGNTALFDAVYTAIEATLAYSDDLRQNDFSVNGVIFIITDGDDNASINNPKVIKDRMEEAIRGERIESLQTILIGVNDTDIHLKKYLENFVKESKLSQYVSLGAVDASTLAKLANFISKSISSQSQSLGTGSSSVLLTI